MSESKKPSDWALAKARELTAEQGFTCDCGLMEDSDDFKESIAAALRSAAADARRESHEQLRQQVRAWLLSTREDNYHSDQTGERYGFSTIGVMVEFEEPDDAAIERVVAKLVERIVPSAAQNSGEQR